MAKIPLYSSKEQLTTVSPQAVRESPQAAGQFGRDLQGVGNAMTQAHDTIRQAYDFQQVGSAKLKTLEGVNAITARAEADGDNTGDLSKYESDFQTLKSDTLKGITNPSVRAKFAMDFDLQASQTKTQITSLFRKNMVSKGLANLSMMNEHSVSEYAKTGDISYLEDMGKNIDSYVTQGFITADDGQKRKSAAGESASWNRLVSLSNTSIAEAKEYVSTNPGNMDAKTLDSATKYLERKSLEVENDTTEELDRMHYDGTLTKGIVDSLVKSGSISAKTGESYIEALDKDIAGNPDPFVYNSMLERAAKVSKMGGVWKTQKELGEMFKEAILLRTDIMKQVGKSIDKEEAGDILKKLGNRFEKFEPYRKGIIQLEDYANKNYTPKQIDDIKQQLYQRFMWFVEKGTDPIKAIQKAKDTYEKYKIEDLEFTAKEAGITIEQVVNILEKKGK